MTAPYLSRPGDLRHRVEIQGLVLTRSPAGGMQKNWVTVCSPMVSIRHLSGNERGSTSAAGGETPVARTEMVMRYRPGINQQMRVLHKAMPYDIDHINNWEERNIWLRLTCKSGVSHG